MKISLVIITKNEERNIERCLLSVKDLVDEILVLDSESTDKTIEIARNMGAKIIPVQWLGYAETKNTGNEKAQYDWILSLDADEALDAILYQEILTLKTAQPLYNAYQITRLPNFCGHWIHHSGWNPDKKIRLFNRKHAHWVGQYVHEKLVLKDSQPFGVLKGYCYHFTVYTLQEHVAVNNYYSELQMQEFLDKGKTVGFYHLVGKPFYEFVRCYFIKGGWLDGWAGFILSVQNAHAKFLKFAKVKMYNTPK